MSSQKNQNLVNESVVTKSAPYMTKLINTVLVYQELQKTP